MQGGKQTRCGTQRSAAAFQSERCVIHPEQVAELENMSEVKLGVQGFVLFFVFVRRLVFILRSNLIRLTVTLSYPSHRPT